MRFQNGGLPPSISRRNFCAAALGSIAGLAVPKFVAGQDKLDFDVAAFERPRVLSAAKKYLSH